MKKGITMDMAVEEMKQRLGRVYVRDDRDTNYRLPLQLTHKTFRSWLAPGVLDQGNTPHCVAFAGVKMLTALPQYNRAIDTTELYNECQKKDEWTGENYDGTSVRALFKVFKDRGFVSEYRWAWDVPTVINHVLEVGPVVMGTNWTYNMFFPDQHGYIYANGVPMGGHAYIIPCVNTRRKNPDGTTGAARILNSWGEGWGQKGRAWIPLDDLDELIKANGEACAPMEIHHHNVKS